MRKIAKTIYVACSVTFAVFLCDAPAVASEVLNTRFGGVSLNFPYPDKLCLLGRKGGEKAFWDHQTMAQRQAGNKLLVAWLNCEAKRRLRDGESTDLKEWVLVVAQLSGATKTERTFPKIRRDQYIKSLAKAFPNLDLNEIKENMDRAIEKANSVILGDKAAVALNDPINLGVLGVEDAVYFGMILNVGNKIEVKPIAFVGGLTILNGAPVAHYTYRHYEGEKTISELLSKAKYYNAKLIFSN